jgi:hypothetical protein
MENLIKKVSEDAGITETQASVAVETMAKFVKDRVPPIIHKQLDKIFAGYSLEESIRNQVGELGGDMRDKAGELAKDLKTAFENAFKSTKKS